MTAKLSSLPRISREDLQGAPAWVDPLLQASNEFQEQATAQINRNLLTGVLGDYKFVHGAELQIKNPLGDIPKGISAVRCQGLEVDSSGKTTGKFYDLDVDTLRWRAVQTQPGQPQRIGVTVLFSPPFGSIDVQRTSNFSVAYNSATAMQWTSVLKQYGTTLSWSSGANTKVTCSAAGRVSVSTDLVLYDTAAGGWRETYWKKNGAAPVYGYDLTPGGVYAATSGSGEVDVSVGDYFELYLFQNQTAAVALNALASSANPIQGIIRYISPPSTATGRVTLRFDGGN